MTDPQQPPQEDEQPQDDDLESLDWAERTSFDKPLGDTPELDESTRMINMADLQATHEADDPTGDDEKTSFADIASLQTEAAKAVEDVKEEASAVVSTQMMDASEFLEAETEIPQGPPTPSPSPATASAPTAAAASGAVDEPPKTKAGIAIEPAQIALTAPRSNMTKIIQATLTVCNETGEPVKVFIASNQSWLSIDIKQASLDDGAEVDVTMSTRPADIPELAAGNEATAKLGVMARGSKDTREFADVVVRIQDAPKKPKTLDIMTTTTTRLQHWSLYVLILVAGIFGLGLTLHAIGYLTITHDMTVIRALLGIAGAAGVGGAFFLLKDREKQLDRIEDAYEGSTLSDQIEEPQVTSQIWPIAFAVFLALVGAVAGYHLFSIGHRTTRLILGLLGGGFTGYLGTVGKSLPFIPIPDERQFNPLHLIRPIATGAGLLAMAMALGLLGFDEEGMFYFTLLGIVGVIGIAGSSLRQLPLRIHQIIGHIHVALLSGVMVVAAASLVTLFDKEDFFTVTFRYSFSPAGIVHMARENNLIVASFIAVGLVIASTLAVTFTLQAYGYDLRKDKTTRRNLAILLAVVLSLGMALMLPTWIILAILPLGIGLEGWLLWLIPFATFTILFWLIRKRPARFDSIMDWEQKMFNKMTFVPPFLSKPMSQLLSLRSHNLQPILTWQLGWTAVLVGSLLAAPMALLSIWWIAGLITVAFLVDNMNKQPAVAD